MGRPSFSPPHNVEVPITCCFKNLISLWNRSFKIVLIQSKSNINRKTKQLIERSKHYGGGGGGGKNGPAHSFPTQQCSTNNLVGLKT